MYRGESSNVWRLMGRALMLDRFFRLIVRLLRGRL